MLGKCKKLCPVWKGPYLIVRKRTANLFVVQGPRKEKTEHHDRIKPCRDRDLPIWLQRGKPGRPMDDLGLDWLYEEPGQESPEGELFCVCRRPDDGSFMIGCDKCNGWFHGACVGVKPEEAETMEHYECPTCRVG
ncbi:histone lysine demethylase PHF8-like [Haliotis cracherodii]|uniref:histone lysine demethylase PHF8-like n=1 Tax=Haliotis cracherodii TaxID=6455 RepID=UPI0039E85EA3